MDNSILLILLTVLLVFIVLLLLIKILSSRKTVTQERLHRIKVEYNSPTDYVADREQRAFGKNLEKALESNARTAKFLDTLKDEMYSLGMENNIGAFILTWIALVVLLPVISSLLHLNWVITYLSVFIGAFAPLVYLQSKRNSRTAKLEKQLGTAINIICNALKAGYSFQEALNTIGREMEEPISVEFGRAFKETQYGLSLSDALLNMAKRVNSRDIELLEVAVSVQGNVGGNIIEMLQNIAETIRIRHELAAEVKSKTAAGRLSGIIVAAIPFVLLLTLRIINPEYIEMFFTTKLGIIMLIAAGIMELIGFLVIRKIVNIKY